MNNAKHMFSNCHSLTSIDLSTFKTKNITMDYMFENCINLNYLDISNFDIPDSSLNCVSNIPENGKIKVNKNISEFMRKIFPNKWIFEIK